MKNCSSLKFIVCLGLSFVATSCVVYHPHNVDIPLLQEQGEVELDASLSLSAPLMGAPALNASVSYAPFNHVGVQAAVSLANFPTYYAQGAAGGFLPFGNMVLEGYAGYGYGNTFHEIDKNVAEKTYRVTGHYSLVFGQVNFGWVNLVEGLLDVGFGLKGGVMYPDFGKYQVTGNEESTLLETHTDHHLLLQPQFVIRAGWKQVKLSLNIGAAHLTDWPESNNYFNYERISVGAGVHFEF